MKFWETKQFQMLKLDWYERLEVSGFQDIENEKNDLKQFHRQTVFHKDQTTVAIANEFFKRLKSYIDAHQEIPRVDRMILELYCQGRKIRDKQGNGIIDMVPRCDKTIRTVIKHYRGIILKK